MRRYVYIGNLVKGLIYNIFLIRDRVVRVIFIIRVKLIFVKWMI